MLATRYMAATYDANRTICKYVHSTSLGHQAIQLATAFHLQPNDIVSPYYRDESMLLGMGFSPYELMLQLLAKADDPFSGGRSYYSHPSGKHGTRPYILHQSSATGMQAIPATGAAHAFKLLNQLGLAEAKAVIGSCVVCSLGDASMTEGEVSEALQVAALYQLPILYLVQDNGWGISVTSGEARSMDAVEYAAGFKGIYAERIDGTDFAACYNRVGEILTQMREQPGPVLLQAKVPLLGHHTSGVRREFYRNEEELALASTEDPIPKMSAYLVHHQYATTTELEVLELEVKDWIEQAFELAKAAAEPLAEMATDHVFSPSEITSETGERSPRGAKLIPMVDAGLFAIKEIMAEYPEAILYGQDVGKRLGGVFREAATLGQTFGDHRVFNTAIQEAYIVGSTMGMSAVGIKPIVEIQFADYVYPALNQLVTELSKSNYLSTGKCPVQALIRIPCGAYGGGGPYHSGSIESTLLSFKGIKVVYPSNAADMKGLMKAAFLDPNPVIMLEHKGLYWSKVPGTEMAKCPEPSTDYVIPLGKGRVALDANPDAVENGETCCVITYGMGVYWALEAANQFAGKVEIVDLRSLYPLDEELIFTTVKRHGKCLVLTEEQQSHSFAESLAGRIQRACFQWLDAPVGIMGAEDVPAIPINLQLEAAILPNAEKLATALAELLSY